MTMSCNQSDTCRSTTTPTNWRTLSSSQPSPSPLQRTTPVSPHTAHQKESCRSAAGHKTHTASSWKGGQSEHTTPSRYACSGGGGGGGSGPSHTHRSTKLHTSGTRTRDRWNKAGGRGRSVHSSRRRGEGTGHFRGARTRCLNCGEVGHVYRECAQPLTSYGVILFRRTERPERLNANSPSPQHPSAAPDVRCASKYEYLMICRRHSFGYTECVRAQFDISSRKYTKQLLSEMTVSEREKIATWTFEDLWEDLWQSSSTGVLSSACGTTTEPEPSSTHADHKDRKEEGSDTSAVATERPVPISILTHTPSENTSTSTSTSTSATATSLTSPVSEKRHLLCKCVHHWRYEGEYVKAKNRFGTLRASQMFQGLLRDLPESAWTTPEWGFPKGKRNRGESGYRCAVRELGEETGVSRRGAYQIMEGRFGIVEELFQGTDGRKYRHVYYIGEYFGGGGEGMRAGDESQAREVSEVLWCGATEAENRIRGYNKAKKGVLREVVRRVEGERAESLKDTAHTPSYPSALRCGSNG